MKVRFAVFAVAWMLVLPLAAHGVEKGYTVFHGSREDRRVAVTVDDCYDAAHVQEILDLCGEYDAPVTFFVIGKALKTRDGAMWREAIDMGCEIGNHTWSHARLPDLNSRDIKRQLRKTQERLNEVLGFDYPMTLMRPPYGRLSSRAGQISEKWVVEAIEEAGYVHAVRWDVSQTDPAKALRRVQSGSILLYHANAKDVRCLRTLIPALQEAGYTLCTVSALLGLDAPETGLVAVELGAGADGEKCLRASLPSEAYKLLSRGRINRFAQGRRRKGAKPPAQAAVAWTDKQVRPRLAEKRGEAPAQAAVAWTDEQVRPRSAEKRGEAPAWTDKQVRPRLAEKWGEAPRTQKSGPKAAFFRRQTGR